MNKKLIIIVSIAVVLILGLIVFMISKSTKSDKNQNQSAPTIGINNEATIEDVMKDNPSTSENESFRNEDNLPSNVISEEELKNSILSNSSTSPKPRVSEDYKNDHDVYGNYDMWQNSPPKNNKIGYSEIENTSPKKEDKNTITSFNDEFSTPESKEKKQQIIADISAESITQGVFSNNRNWSFLINDDFDFKGNKFKKNKSYAEGIMKIEGDRVFCKIHTLKTAGKKISVEGKVFGIDEQEGYPLDTGSYDSSESMGEILESEASNQVSRIPLVGGIINRTTNTRKKTNNTSISISDEIQVKIKLYQK